MSKWYWTDTADPQTVGEFTMPDGSVPMPAGCTRIMQLNDSEDGEAVLTCFDIDIYASGPGWGSVVPGPQQAALIRAAPALLRAAKQQLKALDGSMGDFKAMLAARRALTSAVAFAETVPGN